MSARDLWCPERAVTLQIEAGELVSEIAAERKVRSRTRDSALLASLVEELVLIRRELAELNRRNRPSDARDFDNVVKGSKS